MKAKQRGLHKAENEKASQLTKILVPTLQLDKLMRFVKEDYLVSTSKMVHHSKFLISMHIVPFMF